MKVYETKFIRNIALLGHGGAGKTTLAEAMAFTSGITKRLGKIESGNTISDFDQEEVKRRISIKTSVIPIEWKEYKLNILDTPGYFDFIGETKEALSVADAALIVMHAGYGVQVGSEKAWEYVTEANVPKMIFLTSMDDKNVDYEAVLTQCKEKFGNSVAPMQVPWYEGDQFIGYIHVPKMMARRFIGTKVETCEIPDHLLDKIAPIRTMILEAVAETDEVLMEKYFADEEITTEEIMDALKKGVAQKEIVPVLCGSSVNSTGISVLMDTMVSLFPSPDEGNIETVVDSSGKESEVRCTPDEKPSLFVFKTIVDPFIGKFSLFKVKTGVITADNLFVNTRTEEEEKLAHLYVLRGKEQHEVDKLYAGDIGAAAKLKTVKTSDTLADKGFMKSYQQIGFPEPYVKMAIFPVGKGDEEKMSTTLHKLMAEDPTFKIEYDKETKETVIYGIGEQQLDVIVNTLKNKFKVDVTLKAPTTRYRETIKGKVNIRGKHKKQSGGHGQYGDVVMDFMPSGDLDTPYVFEEKIFGGAVPKQYFPAVEKGLEECVKTGVLAGYPVVGLKATLVDGSYHPVDSSEMAFKMATTIAFKEGLIKAQPTILEPIALAEIAVPDEYTGDIMGDMKKRRGRMIGMDLVGNKQVIKAEVPMAELYRYATDVRSMTQGRGDVSYKFIRYEEAPQDVQQKVIAAKKEQA